MSSLELVTQLIRFLVPALLVCILATIARAVALSKFQKKHDQLLTEARKTLVVAASTSGTDLRAVRAMPFRVLVKGLIQIARSVTGPELTRVRIAADQLGVVRRAERMCTSVFWWRRLYGARVLTVLGTNNEVVPSLVMDRNALVRAQVAEWVAMRQDSSMIENLIKLVYDPVAYCRYAAKDALLRLGSYAVSPVAERLKLATGEEALPLLEIAAGVPNGEFLESARRLSSDALPATRAAAADTLGAIGGEDAVNELTGLLDDSHWNVRRAAARALGRIEHWPAATRLGAMLDDPVWEVRTAAAGALRALGAPGELMLRRLARESGTAADVAQQALDLARTS
ncbi:MAG TPA: HEAT repeat domain-containing protein [Longimicrobiales bacterium]|nr:HEAT repeat domain-containing protein [Longimicrobiales bacterium]